MHVCCVIPIRRDDDDDDKTWTPVAEASLTHIQCTHLQDTVLTLFVASWSVIRVELGERGLERLRGGEGGEVWCRQMFEM